LAEKRLYCFVSAIAAARGALGMRRSNRPFCRFLKFGLVPMRLLPLAAFWNSRNKKKFGADALHKSLANTALRA
jgi:hypothetical protein